MSEVRIDPLRDSTDNIITNKQGMVSMLYNYFCSVLSTVAEDDHITTNDSDAYDERDSAPLTNLEHTLANFDMTTTEILKTINCLKTKRKKSRRPGNMYPKFHKQIKSKTLDSI